MKLSELLNLIEYEKDAHFDISIRSGDGPDKQMKVIDVEIDQTEDGAILIFEVDE